MSKQEARLPEKVQHELDWLVDRLRDYGVYDRELHVPALRSAILAALDEARDEALERASKKLTEIADERGHHGSGTVRLFVEWCALKSKRGA